ncbi:MAG: 4-(cytidine 5'-diphospho)-2-C-methyl-D-erythritol kinase [Candidatus Omnitrophica bacterium]|nr:4-(cytidine 5'-diphospho)-2-C-methyl-D-erythritol kinase [Candidatus Omnitrophota bacterium]
MRSSFRLRAPAKVNLYLAVLGKRPDGYHNIYTLFQRISLFDEMNISTSRRKHFSLRVSGLSVPADKSNLVYRAYQLLLKSNLKTPSVKIVLKKRIPVAAGLGGGSSDAGTFLLGMNRQFKLGFSHGKIYKMARNLGADVSFFASGLSSAIGVQRGDRLKEAAIKTKLWFVIVPFSNGLSTMKIYSKFNRAGKRCSSLTNVKHDVNILSNYLRQKDLSQVGPLLRNDLAPICLEMKPAVKRVLNFMRQKGAGAVSVSGSGPTCFAIFLSRLRAEYLARVVRRKLGFRAIVAHSF